jgi:uncharacterized glyoxalase superfamily protein PhnB
MAKTRRKGKAKARVSPVPKGYHTVSAGLSVRNAEQAIEFYKKAFGAKEKARMYTPGTNTIMHAELQIGDSKIMLGEEDLRMSQPSPQSLNGTPVNMYVYVKDVDKVFDRAVNAGATVMMPVADMFWGDRYGHVVDPFGHKWGIATRKRNVSPKEMKTAAEQWFAQQARQQ